MRRISCGQWGLRLTLAGFAVLVFIAVRWYLGTDTVPLFDTVTWHVVDESADILWQKDTSCLKNNDTGTLTVVRNQVIFHQFCLPGIAVLKALDLATGEQIWWATSGASLQLLSVGDGVVNFEDKTTLVKYDLAGQEVWRVGDFAPQGIERIGFQDDRLYALQGGVTDILSTQTGERLDQIEGAPPFMQEELSGTLRDVVASQTNSPFFVMEGYLYLYTSSNSLQIYEMNTAEQVAVIPLERSGGYTGSAYLLGAGSILIIAYPATHEIIALNLALTPAADQ